MIKYNIIYMDEEMCIILERPYHCTRLEEVLNFLNDYGLPEGTIYLSITELEE